MKNSKIILSLFILPLMDLHAASTADFHTKRKRPVTVLPAILDTLEETKKFQEAVRMVLTISNLKDKAKPPISQFISVHPSIVWIIKRYEDGTFDSFGCTHGTVKPPPNASTFLTKKMTNKEVMEAFTKHTGLSLLLKP